MQFIDIHCHLLPDLDDGSASILETVEMLRIAHRRGTRGIVATPHAFQPIFTPHSSVALCGAFSRMTEELSDLSHYAKHSFLKEMAVYLGSENLVSPKFLDALENRQILTVNGSRYLLVEFPRFVSYHVVESALEQILKAELIPILAHVERYEFFLDHPGRLARLRQKGCVIQVNASSLQQGSPGVEAKLALSVARLGLLDVIASDAHDRAMRPPDLQTVFEHLSSEFSEESLEAWLRENPARILANQDLVAMT